MGFAIGIVVLLVGLIISWWVAGIGALRAAAASPWVEIDLGRVHPSPTERFTAVFGRRLVDDDFEFSTDERELALAQHLVASFEHRANSPLGFVGLDRIRQAETRRAFLV